MSRVSPRQLGVRAMPSVPRYHAQSSGLPKYNLSLDLEAAVSGISQETVDSDLPGSLEQCPHGPPPWFQFPAASPVPLPRPEPNQREN